MKHNYEFLSTLHNYDIIYIIGGGVMEPNEELWFYIHDRQQQGPIGTFELKKLFEQGVLCRDTYLWTSSSPFWRKANTLEPFKNDFEKDPINAFTKEKLTENFENITFPKGRPFVRFMARIFDLSLFTLFFSAFVSIYSPELIIKTSRVLLFFINLFLWVLCEPLIISIFGNTIGKMLLHTKIKSVNGGSIDFWTAFKRSMLIIAAGMGFGIPLITFICNLFSYLNMRKHGRSIWDNKTGTIVLYGNINFPRVFVSVFFPLSIFIAGILIH